MRLSGPKFFVAGFLGLILLGVLVQMLVIKRWHLIIDEDFLQTSDGPLHRDDKRTQEILNILFPGYEAAIKQLKPDLLEPSQFALPVLLMPGGHQVRVTVPGTLPLELAPLRTPDIVIFGSSRTREGIRPDVLSGALGGATVLNLSVSGANAQVIELLFDALADRAQGKLGTVVFFVDDFALTTSFQENYATWRRIIGTLDRRRSFFGGLSHEFEKSLRYLPQFRRRPPEQPLDVLRQCGEAKEPIIEKKRLSLQAEKKWTLSADAVAAYARAIEKAKTKANRVLVIETPVTWVEHERSADLHFREALEKSIRQPVVSAPLEEWGLSTADFFGSEGGGPCAFDPHHVNSQAAIRMTQNLAAHVRASLALK